MKNKRNRELAVCGFEAVKSLENNNITLIRKLYFTPDRAPQFGDLCKYLSQNKVPYNQVESSELEKLSGSVHHQGVVAMIPEPEIERLSPEHILQWVRGKEDALLLDRVGNANNLGAIIRSAAFFGIKNVIIPLDEAQSSITTSSYRVAQGGMEKVSVFAVQSISNLLADLKGKMIRFGTDVRGKIPISDISSLCETKASVSGTTEKKEYRSAMIILGNEETGISAEVKDNCDYLVTIPSPAASIESLNVAQAAAIILYEVSKKYK